MVIGKRLALVLSLVLAIISADIFAVDSPLTSETLLQSTPLNMPQPVDFALWPQPKKDQASSSLAGQITLISDESRSHLVLTEHSASYSFELNTRGNAFTRLRKLLPEIVFDYITLDNKFIPTGQALTITEHPHWDYILGVGDIWQTGETGHLYQVVMPFNLVEKNQNCVHNGVLSFVINKQQVHPVASQFYYQISSETCLYYKADMWGVGEVKQTPTAKQNFNPQIHKRLLNQYVNQQKNALSIQPISQLAITENTLSDIDLNQLSLAAFIKPTDMTMYGLAFEGQYYSSECHSRAGIYPYCSELVLPSYSTAKTIFAGLSMYLLQQEFPQLYQQKVSEWVPQCDLPQWQDVTFLDVLNMATGNYDASHPTADEGAEHSQQFFAANSHVAKIDYACRQFKRRAKPGTKFVYHTSDSYLLGTALNRFIKGMNGPQTDLFDYVFTHQLWPKLKLNPVAYATRRTSGKEQQPFVGFGLFFTRDDIFKVSQYLSKVSTELFKTTLTEQAGVTRLANTRYDQSFWQQNIATHTDCKQPHWLPYLSGYGGISVVLANPTIQYFYFSDSGIYDWSLAINELHNRQAICSKRTKYD